MRSRVASVLLFLFLALTPASLPVQAARLTSRMQAKGPDSVASETSNNRIGAVVDTLKDLLISIEEEEKAEAKNYKCYVQWCSETKSMKSDEIENAQDTIDSNKVAVNEHTATIAANEYVVKKNKEDIEEVQDALQQAEAIRNEENTKYAEDKSLNQQSVAQLSKAIEIVQRMHQTGFLQQNSGEVRAAMDLVQKQNSAVMQQLAAPGESSFVLGVFKSLLANMQKTQEKADEAEAKKLQMYNKLSTNKNQQLSDLQAETKEKSILLQQAKTKLTQAEADIDLYTKTAQEAEAYLKETTAACDDKAQEWSVRQEDRAKEKAAIREAVSFLEITFKQEQAAAALLQQKKAKADAGDDDGSAGEADAAPLSFVQFSSSQASSGAMGAALSVLESANESLNSLSDRVDIGTKRDIYENVKKVINKVVAELEKEQSEAEEKKKYCESEQKAKDLEHQQLTDKHERLSATVKRKSDTVAGLESDVGDLNRMIDESKKKDDEAGKLRKDARSTYEKGSKDRKLAMSVLKEAKVVLMKFYESQDKTAAALAQTGKKQAPPPETFSGSSRKSGEGNIVIAMIEKIIDDVALEQQDAETEENKARAEFEQHIRESQAEFDDRMAEMTTKMKRKAKLLVQIGADTDDRDSAKQAVDDTVAAIAALKNDCDAFLKGFKEASKARAFEVAQLKDVFDILSGSQVAARTGFLEGQVTTQNKQELDELRAMSNLTDEVLEKTK